MLRGMSGDSHDATGGTEDGSRAPREGLDDEVLEFAQMLFQLAREGEAGRLAEYVDAGVTPDLTNERGDAFLMLAAYNGHLETVRVLIERGATVDRPNDRGQTPLAGAVFKGYGEVVRLLFEAGADPYAGTPSAVDAARMFEKDAFLELFRV